MGPVQPLAFAALYRAVMKEAAAQGRDLAQRCVARAAADMPQAADRTGDIIDKNLLKEAARVLASHHVEIVGNFPQALLAGFAHAIAGDARKDGAVSFDALGSMGDEQVQESVEVARSHERVAQACEEALGELEPLLAVVQRSVGAGQHANPLRPAVYVRALHAVIQQSPVPGSVRRRWMTHLGAALGPELAACYRDLSKMLQANGVTPQGSVRMPAAAPAARINVHELRRLLTGEFDSVPSGDTRHTQPATAYSMTVPAALEAAQEMRQLEEVRQRMRRRRRSGGEDATPAQALSLEVVGLMVENIAGDTRLLPEVQLAVRTLMPALERLALAEPRFFSDRRHPARELLDEMTQRSLAWKASSSPGFADFMEPLREAVQALAQGPADGADAFHFALQVLREAWDDGEGGRRSRERAALRALAEAEKKLSGDELESRFGAASSEAAPPASRESAPVPGLDPALLQEGLAPRAWVEIHNDGEWQRWQLAWISANGNLFFFTHATGRSQPMTRRLVAQMLADGRLRVVSSQAVVEGALDAVAHQALRNSAA